MGKNDIQLIHGLADLQNRDLRWLDEESSVIKTRPINNQDRFRFIKAIVNGYEVEEQKYVLPMEGTVEKFPGAYRGETAQEQLYAYNDGYRWRINYHLIPKPASKDKVETVTQSQIDNAPAWVKAINPVPIEEADDD
ncbi:hypothetical protein [Secundilactobacillus oryzae]|uniref:hypothetical protein n=1 Tax=Secundilactobacillus oryzae TaxID=1202668 RepID=UPI0006D1F07A|nr:hypothetical protein [Secundilactobacillus oryzae]